MRFVMSGDEYIEGVKKFMKVYYKEELRQGSLKKAIIVYSLCLIVLVGFCALLPGMKDIFLMIVGFLVLMTIVVFATIIISVFVSSKKNEDLEIDRVEILCEKDLLTISYVDNKIINNKKYGYDDIKKVVETDKYFYLFLNDAVAIPLIKKDGECRMEFISLFKSKNISVKELLKNEN